MCLLFQGSKYARELCWDEDTEGDDGVDADVKESLKSKVLFVLEEGW
jgi:hypothetical protein